MSKRGGTQSWGRAAGLRVKLDSPLGMWGRRGADLRARAAGFSFLGGGRFGLLRSRRRPVGAERERGG